MLSCKLFIVYCSEILPVAYLPIKPSVEVFDKTEIQIRADGKAYLGGYVGQKEPAENYLKEKIKKWINEVEQLARFGKSQPHAAFAALRH